MEPKKPRQVVILIRGMPGIGKTTLATALATTMGFPLVMKDDVRDVAVRWDKKLNDAILRSDPDSSLRVDSNDMTYEVCFAIGLTQLRVGASGVIFESPLGRVQLGEKAVATFQTSGAYVVLVDCYAERSVWEARLATRTPHSHRPRDADQITDHYGGAIDYELETDAHIRIDTAVPTKESVEKVKNVIQTLRSDETSV